MICFLKELPETADKETRYHIRFLLSNKQNGLINILGELTMKSKHSLLKSVILIYILMCITLFVKDVFAGETKLIEMRIDQNVSLSSCIV